MTDDMMNLRSLAEKTPELWGDERKADEPID